MKTASPLSLQAEAARRVVTLPIAVRGVMLRDPKREPRPDPEADGAEPAPAENKKNRAAWTSNARPKRLILIAEPSGGGPLVVVGIVRRHPQLALHP